MEQYSKLETALEKYGAIIRYDYHPNQKEHKVYFIDGRIGLSAGLLRDMGFPEEDGKISVQGETITQALALFEERITETMNRIKALNYELRRKKKQHTF